MKTPTTEAAADNQSKRERNKAEKRRRIVDAASRLFAEKGFEATTTAEISAAADVGTGTLYLYVDSKEGLLVEVFKERVGQAWREGFELIRPEDPVLDQLLAPFLHMARYHQQDMSLSRAYLKELMFTTGPERESVTDFMKGLFGRLDRVLEEAQERDLLCADIERQVLGRNLFAAWYYQMQRFTNGRFTADELPKNIEASFRTSLAGLTPGRPTTST